MSEAAQEELVGVEGAAPRLFRVVVKRADGTRLDVTKHWPRSRDAQEWGMEQCRHVRDSVSVIDVERKWSAIYAQDEARRVDIFIPESASIACSVQAAKETAHG
jgi:hypothetical protein